jgi:hypothetical protein
MMTDIPIKNKFRILCILVTALLITMSVYDVADAYFDRGQTSISLGQSSVSLNVDESRAISVSVSPSSDLQTPSCGMAECPQICGEEECLDGNGQCVCAGTEYSTYVTQVSAVSSNSSVAGATYAGGSLTVRGVSAGTVTITLTATLRQFRDSETTLTVTVNGSSEPPNTGGTGNGGSALADPSGSAGSEVPSESSSPVSTDSKVSSEAAGSSTGVSSKATAASPQKTKVKMVSSSPDPASASSGSAPQKTKVTTANTDGIASASEVAGSAPGDDDPASALPGAQTGPAGSDAGPDVTQVQGTAGVTDAITNAVGGEPGDGGTKEGSRVPVALISVGLAVLVAIAAAFVFHRIKRNRIAKNTGAANE